MPLTLLDVAFWLPTATLPCHEDALCAVVGAAAATDKPLDRLPADPNHFCGGTVADPDHRACLIDTLTRFSVATDAKNSPSGVFA